MKNVALTLIGILLIPVAAGAHDLNDRSPIVYNSKDDEVAVIKGTIGPHGQGDVVIQPTQMFVDLGYYIVVMPRETLRPRERGGWYTTVSNDQLPYLKPVRPTYFQPSGD